LAQTFPPPLAPHGAAVEAVGRGTAADARQREEDGMRRRGVWAVLALALVVGATLQGGTPRAAATTEPASAGSESVAPVPPAQTTLRAGMLPVTAFLGMYLARDNGWLQ